MAAETTRQSLAADAWTDLGPAPVTVQNISTGPALLAIRDAAVADLGDMTVPGLSLVSDVNNGIANITITAAHVYARGLRDEVVVVVVRA